MRKYRIVLVPHGAQWYRILRMLPGLMMASLFGWQKGLRPF
ncbi:MAG TPA: hypothetical protein VHD83_18665 [Puia sp.]|nr:hypothetical protein [Puia sp.]